MAKDVVTKAVAATAYRYVTRRRDGLAVDMAELPYAQLVALVAIAEAAGQLKLRARQHSCATGSPRCQACAHGYLKHLLEQFTNTNTGGSR